MPRQLPYDSFLACPSACLIPTLVPPTLLHLVNGSSIHSVAQVKSPRVILVPDYLSLSLIHPAKSILLKIPLAPPSKRSRIPLVLTSPSLQPWASPAPAARTRPVASSLVPASTLAPYRPFTAHSQRDGLKYLTSHLCL